MGIVGQALLVEAKLSEAMQIALVGIAENTINAPRAVTVRALQSRGLVMDDGEVSTLGRAVADYLMGVAAEQASPLKGAAKRHAEYLASIVIASNCGICGPRPSAACGSCYPADATGQALVTETPAEIRTAWDSEIMHAEYAALDLAEEATMLSEEETAAVRAQMALEDMPAADLVVAMTGKAVTCGNVTPHAACGTYGCAIAATPVVDHAWIEASRTEVTDVDRVFIAELAAARALDEADRKREREDTLTLSDARIDAYAKRHHTDADKMKVARDQVMRDEQVLAELSERGQVKEDMLAFILSTVEGYSGALYTGSVTIPELVALGVTRYMISQAKHRGWVRSYGYPNEGTTSYGLYLTDEGIAERDRRRGVVSRTDAELAAISCALAWPPCEVVDVINKGGQSAMAIVEDQPSTARVTATVVIERRPRVANFCRVKPSLRGKAARGWK